jgi:hypothetical protein
MYNEPDVNFWLRLQVGDFVNLSDEQALDDSIKEGSTEEIVSIKHITEKDNLAKWVIAELQGKDRDDALYLVIKIVDREVSIRVFFETDDFNPGDRSDVIEDEDFWLFEEPEDEDDFEYTDLEYRKEIHVTVSGNEIIYRQKPQGVLYGESDDPEESEVYMASIIEYDTDSEDCPNPELLIIETGEGPNGGYINVMFGTEINFSEIEVFPQDAD